jgi:hypothetical protein
MMDRAVSVRACASHCVIRPASERVQNSASRRLFHRLHSLYPRSEKVDQLSVARFLPRPSGVW